MPSKCVECSSPRLFETTTGANGGYGPTLLPGLGRFLHVPRFRVLICESCGLTRFYAEPAARSRLEDSKHWRRV
jgi:predicted nucleic-acid-binding Zn-ribbon protein